MRTPIALRVASVVSLLLFAGHSAGGLASWSPAGQTAVVDAMKSTQVHVQGFTRSYWQFYIGFGWTLSVYLLAQTVLFWQLASRWQRESASMRPIITLFFAAAVATTILDWVFFFAVPLVMALVIAVCLGVALMPGRST
jgi:hypothetical protein